MNRIGRCLLPVALWVGSTAAVQAAPPARFAALDAWIEAQVAALEPVATTKQELRNLAALRKADSILDRASPATLRAELALTETVLRALPAGDAGDPALQPILATLAAEFLTDCLDAEWAVAKLDDGSRASQRKLRNVNAIIDRAQAETDPVVRVHLVRQGVTAAGALAGVLCRPRTLKSKWKIMSVDAGEGTPILLAVPGGEVVLYAGYRRGAFAVRSATIRKGRVVALTTEIEAASLRDAAADGAGGLHVLVGRSSAVQYAYRDPGGAWTIEILPSSAGSSTAAVAVDPEDRVWIAYVASGPNPLRVMSRAPGAEWRTEYVPSWFGHGWIEVQRGAVAADHDGNAWLFYTSSDTYSRSLIQATRAADGTWSSEFVLDRSLLGGSATLRVGTGGTLHACTEFATTQYLITRYGRRLAGATWDWQDVPGDDRGYASTLALDASGGVHVMFSGSSEDASRGWIYALLPPGAPGWSATRVMNARSAYSVLSSVIVDSRRHVHAAVVDDGRLSYAWR